MAIEDPKNLGLIALSHLMLQLQCSINFKTEQFSLLVIDNKYFIFYR